MDDLIYCIRSALVLIYAKSYKLGGRAAGINGFFIFIAHSSL
ncbi:hypothetical protein EBME_2265 [bacterium endosymbiont of Mortierella elongata FMR23-6]|nr:hypothetical protein EBME_2265 [bacterium endosymbiont of Mortierella elongata FMR23-6]